MWKTDRRQLETGYLFGGLMQHGGIGRNVSGSKMHGRFRLIGGFQAGGVAEKITFFYMRDITGSNPPALVLGIKDVSLGIKSNSSRGPQTRRIGFQVTLRTNPHHPSAPFGMTTHFPVKGLFVGHAVISQVHIDVKIAVRTDYRTVIVFAVIAR